VAHGVRKVRRAESGTDLSSFDVEMVDLYSLAAQTIAKKEAARMARKANRRYEGAAGC
jgi:hypothetical protein